MIKPLTMSASIAPQTEDRVKRDYDAYASLSKAHRNTHTYVKEHAITVRELHDIIRNIYQLPSKYGSQLMHEKEQGRLRKEQDAMMNELRSIQKALGLTPSRNEQPRPNTPISQNVPETIRSKPTAIVESESSREPSQASSQESSHESSQFQKPSPEPSQEQSQEQSQESSQASSQESQSTNPVIVGTSDHTNQTRLEQSFSDPVKDVSESIAQSIASNRKAKLRLPRTYTKKKPDNVKVEDVKIISIPKAHHRSENEQQKRIKLIQCRTGRPVIINGMDGMDTKTGGRKRRIRQKVLRGHRIS